MGEEAAGREHADERFVDRCSRTNPVSSSESRVSIASRAEIRPHSSWGFVEHLPRTTDAEYVLLIERNRAPILRPGGGIRKGRGRLPASKGGFAPGEHEVVVGEQVGEQGSRFPHRRGRGTIARSGLAR